MKTLNASVLAAAALSLVLETSPNARYSDLELQLAQPDAENFIVGSANALFAGAPAEEIPKMILPFSSINSFGLAVLEELQREVQKRAQAERTVPIGEAFVSVLADAMRPESAPDVTNLTGGQVIQETGGENVGFEPGEQKHFLAGAHARETDPTLSRWTLLLRKLGLAKAGADASK